MTTTPKAKAAVEGAVLRGDSQAQGLLIHLGGTEIPQKMMV